jgi:hypothetical protein
MKQKRRDWVRTCCSDYGIGDISKDDLYRLFVLLCGTPSSRKGRRDKVVWRIGKVP